jgi:hypothetical protein
MLEEMVGRRDDDADDDPDDRQQGTPDLLMAVPR